MKRRDIYNNFTIKKELLSIFIICLFTSFIAVAMAVFRMYNSQSIRYTIYVWNLFLAWIPLVFSISIHMKYYNINSNEKSPLIIYLLMFVWIMFYPNAPYIVTDFIHINTSNYIFKIEDTLEFERNFWIWYDFILIASFAWVGFIIGFISLYLNQALIKINYNGLISWIFVVITSFISGYGIYLGRFIRWNSWDIISNPLGLFESIIKNFSTEALAFSFAFGLFLLLTYILLYKLTNLNIEK